MSVADTEPKERSRGDRLDSWKEIAAYLNRSVRTVQRWTRERELPVHHLATERRGGIHAYRSEIDAWWHARSSWLAAERDEVGVSVAPRVQWLRRRNLAILVIVVVAIAIAAWSILRFRGLEIQTLRRLTFEGDVVMPALSPDGKWFAYAATRATPDGNLDLWLQSATGGPPSRLTETPAHEFDPAFSPDSGHLLYSVTLRQVDPMMEITGPPPPDETSLYETDLSGRTRMVMAHANSGRYSPDGRWIASLREGYGATGEKQSLELGIMPATGGEFQSIPIGVSVDDVLISVSAPVWSPDGKQLIVNARTQQTDYAWWLLSAASRTAVRTNAAVQLAVAAPRSTAPWPLAGLAPQAWLADGTILTKGFGAGGRAIGIYAVRLNPTSGILMERPVALSAPLDETRWLSTSGNRIVISGGGASARLMSVPFDLNQGRQLGAPHAIRERNPGGYAELSISRDGGVLAFVSRQSGGPPAAFTLDLANGSETRVSDVGAPVPYAALSGDGTRVAYGAVRPSGQRPIYVANARGGRSELLCEDCRGRPAEWTPDHRGLLLTRPMFNPQRIGVLDLESRAVVDILQSASVALRTPRIAPDGRWITFLTGDGGAFVAPFRGSQPVPDAEWRRIANEGERVQDVFWSPDGRRIYWMITDERSQATIMTRSFDLRRGEWTGTVADVYRTDWNPALARNARIDVVAGGNKMIMPIVDVQSDMWVGELRRSR